MAMVPKCTIDMRLHLSMERRFTNGWMSFEHFSLTRVILQQLHVCLTDAWISTRLEKSANLWEDNT